MQTYFLKVAPHQSHPPATEERKVVAIESNNTLTNYLAFKAQNTEPITLKIIIKIGMLIIVEVLPNLAI